MSDSFRHLATKLARRKEAESEAGRRWPEGSIAGSRWDGITIDGERSLLVQRQAFIAGAEWAEVQRRITQPEGADQ